MARRKYERMIASILTAVLAVGGGGFDRKHRIYLPGGRSRGPDNRGGKLQH